MQVAEGFEYLYSMTEFCELLKMRSIKFVAFVVEKILCNLFSIHKIQSRILTFQTILFYFHLKRSFLSQDL